MVAPEERVEGRTDEDGQGRREEGDDIPDRPDPAWVQRLLRVNLEGTYWGCSEAVQAFLDEAKRS